MSHALQSTQDRPLVTFALFAYNQERYIREAVEGAFAQTYQPLEIILSDDCSKDRTFEIMQEMAAAYCGPHRVMARRTKINSGTLHHLISVARLARGEILFVAAGDDISYVDRIESTLGNFSDQDIFALSGDDVIIDDHSREVDQDSARIQRRDEWHRIDPTWIHGATAAYRRVLFASLPLPTEKVLFEDVVLSDVLKLLGKRSARLTYPLIKYRYHFNNLSNRISSDSSIEGIEEKSIERWKRFRDAKAYCVESSLGLQAGSFPEPSRTLRRIKLELKYFALLAKWTEGGVHSKLQLLYYGLRCGDLRSSVLRALRPQTFYKLKRLVSVCRVIV